MLAALKATVKSERVCMKVCMYIWGVFEKVKIFKAEYQVDISEC